MKYIKVTKEDYFCPDVAGANPITGRWEALKPELYDCNLKEWFIHDILRRHFTFGQPYCVVCGKSQHV